MARFSSCPNEESLRSEIQTVCAEFGKLRTLRIFTARDDQGRPRCLCLLQLTTPEAEDALRSKLDVFDYGSSLAFWVDVDETWMSQALTH
jgi:hypothetical protein